MNNTIENIELSKLIPGKFHSPTDYENDNLENLINSINKYGFIEPLLVRPSGDEEYEIILGNRRFNAAKSLGLETVPAIVSNLDDTKALDLIISENVHRRDFTEKEEGYLYEQALSKKDSNLKKLSNSTGVSEDRITSKLNLFKKNKQKEDSNENQKTEIFIEDDNNNYINNDIINLSNLNKKEEERDDFIMNNNQFINNEELNTNITSNQNIAQTPIPEPASEPTFGGQFFPSIDNELTDLNAPVTMEKETTMNNTEPNISPLIDLTNTTNPIPSPTENPTPSPAPNISTMPPQPTPSPAMEQPAPISQPQSITQPQSPSLNATVPNPQKIEEPQVVTPLPAIETPPLPVQEPSPAPINAQVSNSTVSEPNSQYPNVPPQISIPDLDIKMPTMEKESSPVPEPVLSTDTNSPQPEQPVVPTLNIPNIEPTLSSQPIASQPQVDISPIQENISTGGNNKNINPTPAPSPAINPASSEQTNPKKDIIPVINMFKTLATSVEAFGYKLNVEESEDMNNYTISIIVEK